MKSPLGLQSLLGLGLLALIAGACSPDPSGTDDVGDSGSDTTGADTTGDSVGEGTDTTGTDTGSNCDDEALQACLESATETPCSVGCPEAVLSCVDASCLANCELAVGTAVAACRDAHCPGAPEEVEICEQACWQDYSTCVAASDCEVHQCQWDAGFCLPECTGCTAEVVLDFAFADSCELSLPELVHPVLLPYFSIDVGGQIFEVADEGTACDAPELGGTIEHPLQGDVLVLCPSVCDAFTDAGSLRVLVEGPC
jgi:hypothetical protein